MEKKPALKAIARTPATSMLNLGPVKIPRAADVLANQLRDEIVGGRLADGEMLPNERELAESSRLSRSSVRDALRMLELEGLIVTKQGRNGGSKVCKPGRDTIVKTVSLFISSRRTRRASLVEARGAIEPSAAMLAAKHRTDDDMAQIRALHTVMEGGINDLDRFLRGNIDWHMAVVRASHNDLLIAFMESISHSVYDVTNDETLNPPEVRQQVVRIHGRITDAIEKQDAAQARRLMDGHVNAYADFLGIT
ncbi:FCD domain-containing protein [Hoeflea sp. WL0058]|uniref:FCD domain-containing protein n=1 Tax=Flavimaribacter sediminis TaxID=2865987 RepID=A0AAE2ZSI0_9HYPH|nr:FCD domain-containing protein [Flavimaribacter sediminis]MBW8638702.1 FCD domain-containing protein [Flavimaribacter sediminis]